MHVQKSCSNGLRSLLNGNTPEALVSQPAVREKMNDFKLGDWRAPTPKRNLGVEVYPIQP
jgi:hypothetical protein